MKLMSEWFVIDMMAKEFYSLNEATNLGQAWEKTFEKWELVALGFLPSGGVATCGLCDLFYNTGPSRCCGCPISKHTGQIECRGTPCETSLSIDNMKETAIRETEFLKKVKASMKKPPLKIVEKGVYSRCGIYFLLFQRLDTFQLVALNGGTVTYFGEVGLTKEGAFHGREKEFTFIGMRDDVIKVCDDIWKVEGPENE